MLLLKFMMQVIRLKANYPEYRLQSVRLDNAAEFSSLTSNDYCMAQGIEVQYSVPYVHTQNSLVESLIKRIKLIANPLLHNYNLSITCWGHAVLHAADLIQLRPPAYHSVSPLYLGRGNAQSIFYLRKFGCAIYAPISHCNVPRGALTENMYLYGIQFLIHYKVPETHDWGFIYGPIH
jgi:hypothetical protein